MFLIKFILLAISLTIAGIHTGRPLVIFLSILELILIFVFTSALSKPGKKTAYIVNSVLCLFFAIQILVLFFSGEFVSALMLENLNMAENLGGMLYVYILGIIVLIIVSFLPLSLPKAYCSKKIALLSLIFYLLVLSVTFFSKKDVYTPYSSLFRTGIELVNNQIRNYEYQNIGDKEKILKNFHKQQIRKSKAAIEREFPVKPNIIVLFVEGLSAEVIDPFNELELNLTPNLARLYDQSLVFTNYYNHTAPTFRGIRGQLYSSYQYLGGYYGNGTGFGEMDKETLVKRTDTKLISLIDILQANNYKTVFINVEPTNVKTTNYFKTFHFDDIISGPENKVLTDRQAFNLLEETVFQTTEPFFIAMYNLGTHHGYDSPDVKYKDGKNSILNKFHNYDAQFGAFFDNLMQKEVFKNTILVLTTDHASYNAPEYKSTFKSNQESFINKIPFLIYWNGCRHEVVDAEGRNSLDFTPTLLDLLMFHDYENYFLGTSLFIKNNNKFSEISALGDDFYYTGNNKIEPVDEKNMKIISAIKQYYAISVNED